MSNWSRIAEVRYGDSIPSAGGVLPIDTSAAHALRGNAIAVAVGTVVPVGALTAAGYLEIDFSGNSNNAWNSVAEVSWE